MNKINKNNLIRIDDRLIHGQVVVGWASHLNPKYIILVDNDIAADIFEKELYLMGVPEEYEGMALSVRECTSFIKSLGKLQKKGYEERYIIVVKNPEVAYQLFKFGLNFSNLNIGGMHASENKKEFNRFVYVDENDLKYFRLLAEVDNPKIDITIQDLPSENKVSLNKLLEKFENE